MDTGTENQFQLALIDLAFQFVGLFLNIILSLFQGITTEALTQLFNSLFGAAPA